MTRFPRPSPVEAIHAGFLADATGPFVTLYQFAKHEGGGWTSRGCGLSDPTDREGTLNASWDLPGMVAGFVQHYRDGAKHTEYVRLDENGPEPMVLRRDFHGVRPGYVEATEEFRLFHNLYAVPGGHDLVRIDDDGTEEIAVQSDGTTFVKARTSLVRRYLAARQLDLLLFSAEYRPVASDDDLPADQVWKGDTLRCEVHGLTSELGVGPGWRYVGKRIVPAGPVESCGVWPFEPPEEHRSFIVGVDETGRDRIHTSDPDALSNYFGANPGAPHYLTPVHFDRRVLQRYYDRPELYQVEDGYIRCAGLWGMAADLDHGDRVIAYLGDLGRDLPGREQDHWRAHNIRPDVPLSETAFRRDFLGQFADARAVDLRLRVRYEAFVLRWRELLGWDLLRRLEGADATLPTQIRVPVDDSQTEFDATILVLSRVFVDSINVAALDARLASEVKDEKGLAKLDRWLLQEGYPERERDLAWLRGLQTLRSQGSAHRKGSGYTKALQRVVGEATGRQAATLVLEGLHACLGDLLGWARDGDVCD